MQFKERTEGKKAELKELITQFAENHASSGEKYREDRNQYQTRFEERKENTLKL